MTRLTESEICQILPASLIGIPEVQALSFAIGNAVHKMIAYADLISINGMIDYLPESVLNLLAIELRSQYYDESMGIDTKREIVKKTILWYHHAGTPSAVQELIETIFGIGEVVEWFDYGGEPYRFKIKTNTVITEDAISRFNKIIKEVKNTRSHMEGIETQRNSKDELYVGSYTKQTVKFSVREEGI